MHTTNGFGDDWAIIPCAIVLFYFKELQWKCWDFFPNQFIGILWFFGMESLISLVLSSIILDFHSSKHLILSLGRCCCLFFCYWKASSLSPDFTEDPGKWQWLRLLQSDLACCVDSLQVSPDRGISFFIFTRLQKASAKIAYLVVWIHWYWLWIYFTVGCPDA